jgi:hypothetical protein
MATTVSTFLADELNDHVFGGSAYTAPATAYLALYISDPGVGDTGTEASGTDYARQAITFGTSSSRIISNTAKITYPAAGAGGWGTVTHVAIKDAATLGNLMMFKALGASLIINAGVIVEVPIGDLDVQFPT